MPPLDTDRALAPFCGIATPFLGEYCAIDLLHNGSSRRIVGPSASPLAPLPIQYADFASWQRDWLKGEVLERQLAYWRQQLAGAPPLLELPTDRPRPAVRTPSGATRVVLIPRALAERLAVLGRREGATLFMTLLA
ncbi:hypothetical protein B4Q13_17150, partial [Lacticaseibacillus rhamnosus]